MSGRGVLDEEPHRYRLCVHDCSVREEHRGWCGNSIYNLDKRCCVVVLQSTCGKRERCAELKSVLTAMVLTSDEKPSETAKNSGAVPLLFRPSIGGKARIFRRKGAGPRGKFRERTAKNSEKCMSCTHCVRVSEDGAALPRKGHCNSNEKSRCRFAADCKSSAIGSISDCGRQ